ncbi:MAG: MFS transporter [Gammaproteobacteria bacterium]|nr:MFS transporter [Gammaproteobacteria bacterium]MBU1489576.1 MFS transporter [Gammaproteobacteria bacterium]MBU2067805.1 MFS transporter [Gammaproteobacteria bacterium]MBU2140988.1 MFS transporter [Gammaproteobacteria bacterium]MBU2217381.1 MFS transporter [Gammaproteobacteria bacterium]
MTGFICIMTETLPAGLLPEISTGLDVSPALAGQTITAYAIGSLIAAIPLTVATQGWRRRRVLLATILGFLFFNSLTALSPNYTLTLFARFAAGAAAGLAWSLLAGYARRMVSPAQQGRAMAVAMIGTPIALSLGVPLGTWLGNLMGWRLAFGLMSGLTLLLIVWVLVKVPDYPGQAKGQRLPIRHVFCMPGIRPILAVVFAWMLAHNILYTYIAPFVAQAGLADRVDLILLVFGSASLIGIWVTGRMVDQSLRHAVLASLAVFALVSVFMGLGSHSAAIQFASIFVWGLTFGGAATLLQTALADTAGVGADAALSMNVVTWNGAIAGGGIAGGILLDTQGAGSLPWAVLMLLLLALAVASLAHRHGFPGGARSTSFPVVGH